MADDEQQRNDGVFHYEGGVPIFDTDARLNKVESEQEAARKRDENYRTEQLKIDRRMMLFTGVLTVCTIATGGISIWQATIAHRSAGAAESAATTAKDTLTEIQRGATDTHTLAEATKSTAETAHNTLINSQKTFEIDERPYLVPENNHPVFALHGLVPNEKLSVNVDFKNIGKTPALEEITDMHLVLYTDPVHDTNEKRMIRFRAFHDKWFAKIRANVETAFKEHSEYPNGHGEDIAPGETFWASTNDSDLLSPDQVAQVKKDDEPGSLLLLFIVATYSDRFHNRYETDSCHLFWGTHPELWHKCQVYNIIR